MVRVHECLHDAQELKRRVRNQFLSLPFHDGAIDAYGPRRARVKVGYVSFTRNKLSDPFYFFPHPFHFFLSCKRAFSGTPHPKIYRVHSPPPQRWMLATFQVNPTKHMLYHNPYSKFCTFGLTHIVHFAILNPVIFNPPPLPTS